MSVELIAISSFVLAILGGLAHFIKSSNLKHLKICGCCQSECQQNEDQNTLKRIESNQAKIDKLIGKVNKLKSKRSESEPTTPKLEPIGDLHIPVHEQIQAIYKRMQEGGKGEVIFLNGDDDHEVMI
jgi:hypothetical protein